MKNRQHHAIRRATLAIASFSLALTVAADTLSDDDLTSPSGTVFGEPGTKNSKGAFDNDATSDNGRWLVAHASGFYTGYDFGEGNQTVVNAVKVHPSTSNTNSGRNIKSFTFYGTNGSNPADDTAWVKIGDSVTDIAWSGTTAQEFTFSNSQAYRAYIFYVDANNGASDYTQIHELEFFRRTPLPHVANAALTKTGTGAYRVAFDVSIADAIGGTLVFSGIGVPDVTFPLAAAHIGDPVVLDVTASDGFDTETYYSVSVQLQSADGSTSYTFTDFCNFGAISKTTTVYNTGASVGVSAIAPFTDGNRLQVNGAGVTFTVGNGVTTLAADIDATARVMFGGSNIAVLHLCGENVFRDGIDFNSVSLVVAASEDVLGGLETVFYRRFNLAVVDSFMTSLGDHLLLPASGTNLSGISLELQRPDSVFTLDRSLAGGMNSDNNAFLTKFGEGTLRVTAPLSYNNVQQRYGTALIGGTMLVDMDAGGSLKSGTGSSIAFGGGTLYVKGKTSGESAFSVGGLYLNGYYQNNDQFRAGSGRLVLDANGGTLTASLGGIDFASTSKEYGRSLDITTKGNVTATTTSSNADGVLLSNRVTFNGADWAAAGDGGAIEAYSGYANSFDDGGHVAVSGDASLNESAAVKSLKIDTGAGGTLSLAEDATLTLDSGALLVTGDGNYTISGGAITGNWPASPASEVQINHQGSGRLVIDADIANNLSDANQRTVLTKSGPGTVVLARNTTHQGEIIVNEGVLEISAHRQLGYYSNKLLMLLGGTLRVTDNVTLEGFDNQNARGVLIGSAGGTFDVADGKTLRIQGGLRGQALGGTTNSRGAGALHLKNSDGGAGELSISEYFFTGGVFIDCGVLRLSKWSGCSIVNPVYFGDGATTTLQLNGTTPTFIGLYGGTSASVVENYPASTKDAVLTLSVGGKPSFKGSLRDGGNNALSLVKLGAGSQSIEGNCSHSGTNFVRNGSLFVNGAFSGLGKTTVAYGGLLGGVGSLAGAVDISGGGAITGGDGKIPGTLTIGSLESDALSKLRVAVGASGAARVNVTGAARVRGTVRASLADDAQPGHYVVLSAEGGLDVEDVALEVPSSKLKWSLAVRGNDLVLRGLASGFSIIVR